MQPPWHFSRAVQAYLLALLFGPLGILLVQALDPPWRGRMAAIFYIAPIVAAAWLGGLRPGVLATVVLVAASLPLTWERLVSNRSWANFTFGVAIYLTIGTFLSWLIASRQNARRRAETELQIRGEAERVAQDERERLRVTLASIGDAVIVTDTNGGVTFMNPVAADLTGWKPEEAAGKPLDEVFRIINEETRQPVESPTARVLRDEVVVGLANHTILVSKDGREIPIDDSGAPIRGKGGAIAGVVLVFRDVTEARRATADRLHLASIVESSEDAIISKNLDGIITSWNRGAQRLYGYNAAEMIGKPLTILIPRDQPDELSGIMQRLRRGELVENLETQRIRKDGSRVEVSLTISPIRNSDGRVIGASKIARDITSRKEEDRRKNEFLALLAHELRNPLAPLRNGLQVMKLVKGDAETVEETRAMMEPQLQQLARLVDDLLDVSRISRGAIELRRERLDLGSVIASALDTCRPLVEQYSHRLTVSQPSEPVYVDGDKTRLAQVLSNLLSNAAKYTDRGGQISVTVECEDHEVVIRIKDSGIGIPENMLSKIFELFTQVDRSLEKAHGGLGVGLTIVKRLIEMHSGSVEAHSPGENQGSEFVVRLPAAQCVSDEQPEKHDEEQLGPIVSRRVLVVDDNQDAASSLAVMLRIMGNDVRTAHDGMEGIEIAEKFQPDFILLDIGMPRMNGFEACRRIREQPWGTKIVIVALTGWGQEEDRIRSDQAGFDGHLVKPIEPDMIQKLLGETKA